MKRASILVAVALACFAGCTRKAPPVAGAINVVPGTTTVALSEGVAITDGVNVAALVDAGGGLFALKVAGVSAATGAPAPGTPAYNPTWYAAKDVYLDHSCSAGSSDSNDCTEATADAGASGPCCTIGEIYRRYGSHFATFTSGQITRLHILTGQTLAQGSSDPYGTIGFTAPNGMFSMVCTPVPSGPTFAAGVVTHISRANPGNDLQVQLGAGADAGAAPAVGQLVFDSTVGAYAFIDAMTSNLATLTQPFATFSSEITYPGILTSDDASWAVNDTLQLYTLPTIYADAIATTANSGTGASNSILSGMTWIQNCNFGNLSASTSISQLDISVSGGINLVNDSFQPYVSLNQWRTGNNFRYNSCINCFANGAGQFNSNGGEFLYGGSVGAGTATVPIFAGAQLKNDVIVHNGATFYAGFGQIYNAHFPSGTVAFEPGSGTFLRSQITGAVWGGATLAAYQDADLVNRTGGTWANNVLVAALRLTSNLLTTGSTPTVNGSFTNNGVTQVDTAGAFPINAPISWSLATLGGTPCAAGGPYFSAAETAGNFFTKAVTASCNDVYNWQAHPAIVSITTANLDTYGALIDPASGARFTN